MVSQQEVLKVIAVGEALSRKQIRDRLPGDLKRTELSNPLTQLRGWGQFVFAVVGESQRGAKIWATGGCGELPSRDWLV